MTDQQTLLGRIAANLRRSPATVAPRPVAAAVPLAASIGDVPALLARFSAEWQSLAGHVHTAATDGDAIDAVIAVCRSHGMAAVLGWADEAIGIPGFETRLRQQGIAVDHGMVPQDPSARRARLQELAALGVGVTGADALLAESGSVVLASGPGRPRLASLLPPVHVTVVRPRRVYLSLEHLLAAEPALGSAGSNLVAISGPSRTADIEMTLTRGVHGPGEVHVILVEDR